MMIVRSNLGGSAMTILMWLSWVVYGGDVERMDHREYVVRAEAYSRLKAAGVWAVPALWAGRRGGTPERAMRIDLLLTRRASWWEMVERAVMEDRGVTDGQLLAVAKVMAADPSFGDPIYHAVDRSGGFPCESSKRWSYLQPYITQDLDTEIAEMLKRTRAKLLPQPAQVSWWDVP